MRSGAAEDWSDDANKLADLLASAEDIRIFLNGLTELGAAVASRSTGTAIECAVTLGRRKRTATIGGSSEKAMLLDRIEQSLEQDPASMPWRVGAPSFSMTRWLLRNGKTTARSWPPSECGAPLACRWSWSRTPQLS